MYDAVEQTKANTSIIFVPARFAADAIMEAADAGIRLIVCIAEGIPTLDVIKAHQFVEQKGAMLILSLIHIYSRQSIAEDRTQEHISVSGMDHLHRNSHLLHDINAIFKREYNTFLSGTDNVVFAMCIEVQSTYAATDFLIVQHTFGTRCV